MKFRTLKKTMNNYLKSLILLASFCFLNINLKAQAPPPNQEDDNSSLRVETSARAPENAEMEEVKRQLREQQKQIEQMRMMLAEQSQMIEKLQNSVAQPAKVQPVSPTNSAEAVQQTATIDERLGKVEQESKKTTESLAKNQLGTIGFSGDLRMQYDSFYGLLNNAAKVENPAILGNELSPRHRVRYRLRFAVRGKIGGDVFTGAFAPNGDRRTDKEFEWGFRLTTGNLANPVSANQVLTDYFSRKPIALDQVYVAWRPRPLPGLRVIAGKFEPTWTRTEMTIDNDLQVEGVSQVYSRDLKNSFLKNVTVSAWQLPMLERGTSFVRNASGGVNTVETQRASRDLGLFGAQIQGRFGLSPNTNLTVSAANLFYSNTDAINPIQVFGSNFQLPVTVTIPATSTAPSQTATGVVSIPRDLLVSGNANLGLSAATTNAVNRDGRLASEFNLIDILAQLEFKQFKYNPVTLVFDYVKNTGTKDVLTADASGAAVFLPNDEDTGVWIDFKFQNLRKKRGGDFNAPVGGDLSFGYTFLRIEKDAVLTPFNSDDYIQPSDIRGHRLFFGYTVNPRVSLNFTGFINSRLNGLNGPFAVTPPGSLDRRTYRLQVDTIFRF